MSRIFRTFEFVVASAGCDELIDAHHACPKSVDVTMKRLMNTDDAADGTMRAWSIGVME